MISQEELTQTIKNLLDGVVPKHLNVESVVSQLNSLEQTYKTQLSAYGYVMFVLESAGVSGIYHGKLSDFLLMTAYAKEAVKHKEDMPVLLVNAKNYAQKVFEVIQDPDLCMPRLEGMSFPYVLFILFTILGQPERVTSYKTETKELLARYPGTLEMLPENFQTMTMEALSADSQ